MLWECCIDVIDLFSVGYGFYFYFDVIGKDFFWVIFFCGLYFVIENYSIVDVRGSLVDWVYMVGFGNLVFYYNRENC